MDIPPRARLRGGALCRSQRAECEHIIWAGPMVNMAALLRLTPMLRGRSCPTCGQVDEVTYAAIRKPTSIFDELPAPRNVDVKLQNATAVAVKKTRRHLAALGSSQASWQPISRNWPLS